MMRCALVDEGKRMDTQTASIIYTRDSSCECSQDSIDYM